MTKLCASCDKSIKDGDDVVAVVVSVFKEIPSNKSFAIEKPTECLLVEHLGCNDLTEELR